MATVKKKATLKRNLKSRHMSMIAIGGTLGAGIFLTSGAAIAQSGPAGTLVAYIVMGLVVFTMMTSLAEMSTYMPVAGAFKTFPNRFVDPALGFANGWSWWIGGAMTVAAELVGSSIIMKYWFPNSSTAMWAMLFLAILLILNLFSVKVFGESSYWLSSIKVVTVTVFIIVGILIITGAIGNENIGFENWILCDSKKGQAPFVGGIGGVISAFLIAGFSFSNIELIGISAAESSNPSKDIKKSTYLVFFVILFFYVGSLAIIGTIIPFNNENLLNSGINSVSQSPFTIIFSMVGLKMAASIINLVILTALLTCGNATLYSVARLLCSMGESKDAPAFVSEINDNGVPARAVIITAIFGGSAFFTSILGDGKIYTICYSIVGISAFLNWFTISLSHYRFRKAYIKQGKAVTELKYAAPFYPYGVIFGIVMCVIVIFGANYWIFRMEFSWLNLISNYGMIPLFILLFFGYKYKNKTNLIPLEDVDLKITKDIKAICETKR